MTVHEIGKYSYQERPLAQDAAGVLYEGTDTNTGEAVYVKEMHSRERKRKTRSDTAVLQGIACPTLASVRDEVVSGQKRYIVVAKAEAELLSHCMPALCQEGIRGRYQMLCILADICKAVEALHRIGIVHGAINPTSIAVKRGIQTQAYLLCFEPFVPRRTSHYLQGNNQLHYLAQEQLRGDGDFASDIYALGMLLYVGFGTGAPFAAGSTYQLAEQIVWGDLAAFTPKLDDLDTTLGQTIAPDIETVGIVAARALQRNPSSRYATVVEVRRVLEQIAQRLSPIVLGRTLYQDGRFELAATVLEEATSSPDASLEANVLLGRIYGLELNIYDQGVKAFKRALRQKPSLDSARLGLAELYTQHGRHGLAKREFVEMLKLRPEDPQLMMGYAQVLRRGGNPDGALNVLHRLQEVIPYFLPAYVMAIQMNLNQGNLKEAEIDCDEVVRRIVTVIKKGGLDPRQVAEIYFLRGLLHHKRDRNARSIRWLEKALEQVPYHSQSHGLLAVLYAEAGQMDKAIHHFLTNLSISPDQGGIMDGITRIFGSQMEQEQSVT